MAQVSRLRQLHRDFEALKPSLERFSSIEGKFHWDFKLMGSCTWDIRAGLPFNARINGISLVYNWNVVDG